MRWPSEPSPDVNHTQILASEQIGFERRLWITIQSPPLS